MNRRAVILLVVLLLGLMIAPTACRRRNTKTFVIAIGDNVRTIDPIGSPSVDAASERVRTLIFNSLVKKNEKFDYVGELASDIKRSDDGLTHTFTLHDGVKFHDGRVMTSADVKYTLDLLFSSNFAKSASFFEGAGDQKRSYIKSVEAPDQHTVVVTLTQPWVGLLSNLVPIPIIPKDSYESQKTHPLGTGPFKFVSWDNTQQLGDLDAFPENWDGPAQLQHVRVRVISDMNALQAELQAGRVDLAPMPTSLSFDAVKRLEQDRNLQVRAFAGSNLYVLTLNTTSPPLDNVKVRQAIAYAIDRPTIIQQLLLGYGKLAHSILPEESWAYSTGHVYNYDPAMAKKLLAEANFRADKPIVYKLSGSTIAGRQYAGVIQNQLKAVGIPVEIQTAEINTFFDELRRGNFQIAYAQWVGGHQDPIFYKDLFATSEIPTQTRSSRNRSRYSNPELDKLIDEAVNTYDRQKARELYVKIQEIVSRDVPVIPLWYQSNIVIARKNVQNIQVNASGDWSFVKNLSRKDTD